LYEKANSMTAETIECPGWMHRFLIGKNGSNLRELIEDNEKVLIKLFYHYVHFIFIIIITKFYLLVKIIIFKEFISYM